MSKTFLNFFFHVVYCVLSFFLFVDFQVPFAFNMNVGTPKVREKAGSWARMWRDKGPDIRGVMGPTALHGGDTGLGN